MLRRRWPLLLGFLIACSLAGPAVGKGKGRKKSAAAKKQESPASAEVQVDPASQPASNPAVRPAVPSAKGDELVFIGVGDMMLGTTFPDETGALLPPDDGAKILAEVAPY